MRSRLLFTLVVLLAAGLVVPLPAGAAAGPTPPKRVLVLPLAESLKGAGGLEPSEFSRAAVATRFDAASGRLVEVAANQPRFQVAPGKPWGAPAGVLLENPATNFLSNSSFEAGGAGWVFQVEQGTVRGDRAQALHGESCAQVVGKGKVLHAPAELAVQGREPLHNLFTFSGYVRREGGEVKLEDLTIWATPQGQTQNAVDWNSRRLERLGETEWYRFSANFGVNGSPLAFKVWECGVELLRGGAWYLDAFQVEQGEPRYQGGATSYIPTGEGPATRAGETLSYPAAEVLGSRGSVSMWVRPTPPAMGYWFCPQPWKPDGVMLVAGLLQVNGGAVRFADPGPGWHLFTATWDGEKAQLYVDGKSVRPEDDPLPYPDFKAWPSPGFALSRAEGGAGSDALLADVTLWDGPLTPAQARQLYATGDIAGAVEPRRDKLTPVRFTVPTGLGTVSLGLFDRAGRLVRTLFSGQELQPGGQEVPWDGRDDDGNPVAVGEYEVRGLTAQVGAEPFIMVGNTAKGPGDDYTVYRCMYGGYVGVAALPDGSCLQQAHCCEGSFTTQRVAADGKVLWSKPCEFGAVGYETHAMASDGKYVWLLQPAQFDVDPATKKLRVYEFMGRCRVEDGQRVLFPGDKAILPVSATREADTWTQAVYAGLSHSEPFPGLNARSLAAGGGKVYVSLHFDNRVDIYDAESGAKTGSYEGIEKPLGVAVDGAGNLYVGSGKQVLRIAPDGGRKAVVTRDMEIPRALAVDAAGRIYVADAGTQQVKRFAAGGQLELIIGQAGGSFNGPVSDDGFAFPSAVAVDRDGRVLITDQGHWRLQVFDQQGKFLASRAGCGTNIPMLDLTRREWLYAEGWGPFGMTLARYRLDWAKRTWRLDSMWELGDLAGFGDLKRVIAHGGSWHALELKGKTYLYKLDATLLMRVEQDRVVPCTAIGAKGCASVPTVRDAQGREVPTDFERRWVWVNQNGDYRVQPDELSFYGEGQLEGWRASYVTPDGTIYLSDRNSRPIRVYRFPLLGIDPAGNPLYAWDKSSTAWQQPAEETGAACPALWGFQFGTDGRAYGMVRDDNYGNTSWAFLACYDAQGKRVWKLGKLTGGVPRPGEFTQPEAVQAPGDGLVYAWDIAGVCQAFTTDGLYVGKMLQSSWHGDPPGPLCMGGETFDAKAYRINGQTYLLGGGNAAFRLALARVTGRETIRRFTGKVRLTEAATPRVTQPAATARKKSMAILAAAQPPVIDGALEEWDKAAGQLIIVPGAEERHRATAYASWDAENLYLAYAILDSSPALNTGVLSTLFNGDCVEQFLSTGPLPRGGTFGEQDYQFVLPALPTGGEEQGRAQVTRIQPKLERVPGAEMRLQVWPDKRGYNVEAKVPWAYFGGFRPVPGLKVGWDWNLDWSDASGSVRALQYYWNAVDNWRNPGNWGEAEFR